ncbi:hypothetical protein D915_002522 [Fasciola hepatica]|uniref:Uncharacterized protein n=1 Tax=Fasciola hepatica TaxID=6192 RepID=A0A4E0S311_FASHE|nr:hypothetical protein D915_002522 [Fasciola hepatica]
MKFTTVFLVFAITVVRTVLFGVNIAPYYLINGQKPKVVRATVDVHGYMMFHQINATTIMLCIVDPDPVEILARL